MTAWTIVTAEKAHLAHLAAHMREIDKKEVWASHGHTPLQALESSFACSVQAWTFLLDTTPAFMWGVARHGSIFSEKGVPWLLGTDAMYSVTRPFLQQSKAYIEKMHEHFPVLENTVHADNHVSIKWLAWCGFHIDNDPIIASNEKFYRFWRKSSCAKQ